MIENIILKILIGITGMSVAVVAVIYPILSIDFLKFILTDKDRHWGEKVLVMILHIVLFALMFSAAALIVYGIFIKKSPTL